MDYEQKMDEINNKLNLINYGMNLILEKLNVLMPTTIVYPDKHIKEAIHNKHKESGLPEETIKKYQNLFKEAKREGLIRIDDNWAILADPADMDSYCLWHCHSTKQVQINENDLNALHTLIINGE